MSATDSVAFATRWGLAPAVQQHFQQYLEAASPARRPQLYLGRVTTEHRRAYEVVSEGIGNLVATLAGRLRHEHTEQAASLPAVGDWVVLRMADTSDPGTVVIDHVFERRTALTRQAAGQVVAAQVIASNVDTVFVVTAPGPDFSPPRVERYRRAIEIGGAVPVVVLNKTDSVVPEVVQRCRGELPADLAVAAISALQGVGVEALAEWIGPGQTVAIVGSSGVGKSTLVNRLCGSEQMLTSEVRHSDGTGQHTTTRRQLVCLPAGGVLLDTPGMREFQLWASTPTGAAGSVASSQWPDGGSRLDPVTEIAQGCRYRNCGHGDEPGCAVRAAVEDGTLTRQQWSSHLQLQRELEHQRRRQDASAARAESLKWKRMTKANRLRAKKR